MRRFSSDRFVFMYSQGLIAKKKAPTANWASAMFSSDVFRSINFLRTHAGRAFCCTAFLFVYLNTRSCWWRMNAVFCWHPVWILAGCSPGRSVPRNQRWHGPFLQPG